MTESEIADRLLFQAFLKNVVLQDDGSIDVQLKPLYCVLGFYEFYHHPIAGALSVSEPSKPLPYS